MGGIADYSGSLVMQMPIAEACHVAVQRHAASDQPPRLRILSFRHGAAFEADLSELFPGGEPLGYTAARTFFRRDPSHAWAAYVGGALVVMAREAGLRFDWGLSILVSSGVPEGKGVSSSAAVEVSVMAALAAAHGARIDGRTLALLCQKGENAVVGAPCGVMDQMSAALGEEARLLALRCQPAEVQGSAPIPPHLQFWGVDSGIVHSVGGSDYGHVRVGTFMGLRIMSQLAAQARCSGASSSGSNGGSSSDGEVAPVGNGYLANVPPSTFAMCYEARLPEATSGADFLGQYSSHWDAATQIDPAQTYAVRTPAGHPVHENFRVHAFRQVLAAPPGGPEQLEVLGELMRQSHASYSRCGLGSDGTDRLVELVAEERAAAEAAGEEPALYGAKITGGGSGGTVCVLGVAGPRGEAALQRVVQRYSHERQYTPKVFRGSSAGAAAFGHLRLRRREGSAPSPAGPSA
ncbi:L-arabinokinase-like isoform X1 [Micractinium conductrix]|uniref:L-arabinokinase-like isoform X1 n=1 Tax=Micractinium conductrix TaxID=554055 RepID=A0A2P6VGP3_9CHLO|nr:L-arabinokinase-like isoform X1 [Micractinium conductrix]|eukprot:PSC73262.1 L-arabinokinase-like isoform X1 [Micractinium conductrix]